MAGGSISKALEALTSGKGAVVTTVAVVAFIALLGIAGNNGETGSRRVATSAAMVQATGAMEDKSGTFTPGQVKALQTIIKDYLINNPEVMVEVTKELERRQAVQQAAEHERLIGENKARIFTASADFVLGNPKGDVTVVEFFDYNCGWCKRALDDLVNLTKSDSKVRVVMKEFPIFGEASVMAAKAAMAANKQGKYWEFHSALMREKQVTQQNLFQIAEKVGLNIARLKADMTDPKFEAALKENGQLAQALNIEGTPGFVIDSRVNVGYLPVDGILQMIGDIRKTGCKMC
jgi:protein-disulfide isomerase